MFDGEVSDNGFTRGRSGLGIGDVEEGVGMKGRSEEVECSRHAERGSNNFLCSSVYHLKRGCWPAEYCRPKVCKRYRPRDVWCLACFKVCSEQA